jgi:hypothetical protein
MRKFIAALTLAIVGGMLGFGISVAGAGGGDNTTPSTSSARVEVGRAPAKASAQVQSAVVRTDGSLARSFPKSGISSSLVDDPGGYEVVFPRGVRKCTYSATLGLPGSSGTADAGFVTVVGRAGNPNAVYVRTMATNGNNLNQSFHLMVSCKPLK